MRRLFAAIAVALCACACAADREPATSPPPTTAADASPVRIDWSRLSELEPLTIGEWSVFDCEGDALLLCFERSGRRIDGVLALERYDRSTFDDDLRTPAALADDNVSSFRADREATCGPRGFRFRDNPRRDVAVAGLDGVRSDWSLLDARGAEVERVISYFAVDAKRVVVFVAAALVPEGRGGCLAPETREFVPRDLAALVGVLDRIVAGSKLPAGTT